MVVPKDLAVSCSLLHYHGNNISDERLNDLDSTSNLVQIRFRPKREFFCLWSIMVVRLQLMQNTSINKYLSSSDECRCIVGRIRDEIRAFTRQSSL